MFVFTKKHVEFLYEEMKKQIKPSDSVMFIHHKNLERTTGADCFQDPQ